MYRTRKVHGTLRLFFLSQVIPVSERKALISSMKIQTEGFTRRTKIFTYYLSSVTSRYTWTYVAALTTVCPNNSKLNIFNVRFGLLHSSSDQFLDQQPIPCRNEMQQDCSSGRLKESNFLHNVILSG